MLDGDDICSIKIKQGKKNVIQFIMVMKDLTEVSLEEKI